MRFPSCVFLALATTFAATSLPPAAQAEKLPPDEKCHDEKLIEGEWVPVKGQLGGQVVPEAVLKTFKLKLTDGKYDVLVGGKPDKGTYALDANSKPKSMTIIAMGRTREERFLPFMNSKKIPCACATTCQARSVRRSS